MRLRPSKATSHLPPAELPLSESDRLVTHALTPHILWSNACSGHPWPGEDTREAAERRLWEEFGFTVALQKLDAFQYLVEDTNSGLIEHEYLHVLHGRFNGEPRPNPDEIGAYRWVAPSCISGLLARRPEWFTPWFAVLADKYCTESL